MIIRPQLQVAMEVERERAQLPEGSGRACERATVRPQKGGIKDHLWALLAPGSP